MYTSSTLEFLKHGFKPGNYVELLENVPNSVFTFWERATCLTRSLLPLFSSWSHLRWTKTPSPMLVCPGLSSPSRIPRGPSALSMRLLSSENQSCTIQSNRAFAVWSVYCSKPLLPPIAGTRCGIIGGSSTRIPLTKHLFVSEFYWTLWILLMERRVTHWEPPVLGICEVGNQTQWESKYVDLVNHLVCLTFSSFWHCEFLGWEVALYKPFLFSILILGLI